MPLENQGEYDPHMLHRNLMFGTPDEVIAKLRAYEEIGVDHFTYYASLGLGMKEQKRSMELFVKEVIPAFACRSATQGMPEREDNTRYSARPR